MSSLLFIEAFGQLMPNTSLIDSMEEDLYSVFRARAELMGWSATSSCDHALFWGMNDADLTAGNDASRIGWVQVSPEVGNFELTEESSAPVLGLHYTTIGGQQRIIEPAVVLPALTQCFDDALRRFGDIELSAIQVTANFLAPTPQSCADLIGTLNWFNTAHKLKADAVIAFDQELLGGRGESELVASIRRTNTGSFKFGQVVAVTEEHSVRAGLENPIHAISPARSGLGVSVTLPEWTASAVGWVLATVIGAARTIAPDVSNFTIRVSRV